MTLRPRHQRWMQRMCNWVIAWLPSKASLVWDFYVGCACQTRRINRRSSLGLGWQFCVGCACQTCRNNRRNSPNIRRLLRRDNRWNFSLFKHLKSQIFVVFCGRDNRGDISLFLTLKIPKIFVNIFEFANVCNDQLLSVCDWALTESSVVSTLFDIVCSDTAHLLNLLETFVPWFVYHCCHSWASIHHCRCRMRYHWRR